MEASKALVALYITFKHVIGRYSDAPWLSFFGISIVIPSTNHEGNGSSLFIISEIAIASPSCMLHKFFSQKFVILSSPGDVQSRFYRIHFQMLSFFRFISHCGSHLSTHFFRFIFSLWLTYIIIIIGVFFHISLGYLC